MPLRENKKKRLPPFSIRLSENERTRLEQESGGAPLGAYIKAKALGSALPVRMRRTGLALEDRAALAQLLALLGRSRLVTSLNEIAAAVSIGALSLDPETLADLAAAIREVREMRNLLLSALGLKPEGSSCS
jgi:hypothetical protein